MRRMTPRQPTSGETDPTSVGQRLGEKLIRVYIHRAAIEDKLARGVTDAPRYMLIKHREEIEKVANRKLKAGDDRVFLVASDP